MISMACSCRGDFWVRDRLAGRGAACPACGATLAVPPLETVKRGMTPAACSCGEVFWSSTWQLGKVSRCPICGGAVGPSRAKGGMTNIKAPETRRVASPMPQTLSTWANGDSPPPDAEPKPARGSTAGAPRARPHLSARRMSPQALALAAGALVVVVVGIIAGLRSLGPAAEGGSPVATIDPRTQAGDREGGVSPAPTPIVAASPSLLRVLVPAYFYPAGAGLQDWNRLIEAAPRVPIVAIVNPESGPGKAPNSDYAAIVSRAKAAGAEVIGYVSTEYGTRPRPEIEADIDRWVRFYPDIRGIFLDAQASAAEHVDLYAALRTSVRRKIKEAVLITNPGTICAEDYFARSAMDVAIVFENHEGFATFELPPWARSYQARQFAAIPYSVRTEGQMKEAAQQAYMKGIGCFYVTDGALPNPWGRLPLYWDAEVDAVRRVNERKSP